MHVTNSFLESRDGLLMVLSYQQVCLIYQVSLDRRLPRDSDQMRLPKSRLIPCFLGFTWLHMASNGWITTYFQYCSSLKFWTTIGFKTIRHNSELGASKNRGSESHQGFQRFNLLRMLIHLVLDEGTFILAPYIPRHVPIRCFVPVWCHVPVCHSQ
jgi:hypothetical protein